MEIVLLWLDELDDLIFAAAALRRSVCRWALAAGLLAAIAVSPLAGAQLAFTWTAGLCAIAAGSVLAWLSAFVPVMRRTLLTA